MSSSSNRNGNGSEGPPKGHSSGSIDPADQFIIDAKKALLPVLTQEIPEVLFKLERESELKKKVVEILDVWLVREKVPIGRQLRLKLLDSILADIARASRERFGG